MSLILRYHGISLITCVLSILVKKNLPRILFSSANLPDNFPPTFIGHETYFPLLSWNPEPYWRWLCLQLSVFFLFVLITFSLPLYGFTLHILPFWRRGGGGVFRLIFMLSFLPFLCLLMDLFTPPLSVTCYMSTGGRSLTQNFTTGTLSNCLIVNSTKLKTFTFEAIKFWNCLWHYQLNFWIWSVSQLANQKSD
jgi:hypothetical protein